MCFKVLAVYDHDRKYVRCWRLGTPTTEDATQEPEEIEGPVNL